MSWVISPVLAGIIAYWLFVSVQYFILNTQHPLESAQRHVPFYIFLVGFIITLVTMQKGLAHTGIQLTTLQSYMVAVGIGVLVMLLGIVGIRRLKFDPREGREFHFTNVEKVFGILMMVTACAMAFAHGSNDVANAVGPLAAIAGIVESGGQVAQKSVMPIWILLLCGAGIVIGLITYGHQVIATVGTGITELTPNRGFAATLASGTGLPISTTHTLVGAVLGVGMARGIAALNMNVVRMIMLSWIVTLPAGAVLSIIFFYVLVIIFG